MEVITSYRPVLYDLMVCIKQSASELTMEVENGTKKAVRADRMSNLELC